MAECAYAQKNKYDRLVCNKGTEGDKSLPLCPYQRYCAKDSEWQNTEGCLKCNRKLGK